MEVEEEEEENKVVLEKIENIDGIVSKKDVHEGIFIT